MLEPAGHNKPEGRIGLVHSVDGFYDRAGFLRLPVILRDWLDHGEDRLIEVCDYGEPDAMVFSVVDDLGLRGGAVGSQCCDLLALRHLPDTVFDKGEISAGR